MIVVSDTSAINNLAAINHLHLLQQLYEIVLIPEAVYRELTDPSFPVAGAIEVQTLDCIQTCAVRDRIFVEDLSNKLNFEKAKVVLLAIELGAKPSYFNSLSRPKSSYLSQRHSLVSIQ